MSFYRIAVPRPPSIGARENAPFVSRSQGSQQHEMRALHCDATRCTKHQSRAQPYPPVATVRFVLPGSALNKHGDNPTDQDWNDVAHWA
jgi:hypothetical protein